VEITFKVSQATKRADGNPYVVLPTLFEVEPLTCKSITSLDDFTLNVFEFHKHLKEVFNEKKYPKILYACDEVLAKIDFCLDFSFGNYNKNHKFSSPLTLFINYNEESLIDVSTHVFLALLDKWQEFYNECIKKESK